MSVTYNMINGISTTDVYQKALPIMGHDYAKIVVNKRLTMQSLLLLQNIGNYIQTIKKLQYSIGKVHKNFSTRLQNPRLIKSYVRTKLVQLRKIIIQLL